MNNKKKLFVSLVFLIFISTYCKDNNKKLNILFCVKSFPAYTNWFILNQITRFIKSGHNVTILARDPKFTIANDDHPDIIRFNLLEKTFVDQLPENLRSFDIILCQFSSLAPYAIDFIEKYNIKGKLFVFVRGAFCFRYAKHKKLRKRIFKKTDLFFAVCNFSKEKMIELGCKPNKVKVVHSTIDCEKFLYTPRSIAEDVIKIVTVSRLVEQKGLEYAIRAIKKVLQKYPNCEYTIIGNGKLYKKLKQLIKTLRLEKKVYLLGWKSPDELKQVVNASHIFIHPSITNKNGGHEGIPTSVMEAMAIGIPVVSTYHAGIPELIENEKNGFLVPEKDVDALAEKIEFLIEHPEVWNIVGLKGRNAIDKKFNKDKENKKLIRICKRYTPNYKKK